jgi:hypothetical protein
MMAMIMMTVYEYMNLTAYHQGASSDQVDGTESKAVPVTVRRRPCFM